MFLRVGSANYAAKVWVNGSVVAEHLGGHLPFVAEVTSQLAWDRKNVIAISVENKQLLDRVPARSWPRRRRRGWGAGWISVDDVRLLPLRGVAPPGAALLRPADRAYR